MDSGVYSRELFSFFDFLIIKGNILKVKIKGTEAQKYLFWDIHRKIDKMKRQRAVYQMKEQDKTPEKQLNEWR